MRLVQRLVPRWQINLIIFFFLMIPMSSCLLAQGTGQPRSESTRFDPVREYIHRTIVESSLPSVSVAVSKNGKIIWEEGFGWANREKMIRATPDTMYSLASISKPFTATGVMRLVEAGKINLDNPINSYLGTGKLTGWAGDASQATVRRVLSHTSGLPLHYQFFYENEPVHPPSMDSTIARYGILVNPPGEVYQYSNLGFGILGYVCSRISGLSYADYMRAQVFIPLGLTHTNVGIVPDLQQYVAQRYDGNQQPIPFYTFDHLGASAIYSSAHDLVRFGMFHLKDHLKDQQKILNDSDIDLMHKPNTPPLPDGFGYALGWGTLESDHGFRQISHTGGMPGVRTVLNLYPSQDLAIVVLTNTENDVVDDIAQKIASVMLPGYAEALQKDKHETQAHQTSFQPGLELTGNWKGKVHTWQGSIPITLNFQPDGDVHVKLGDELETLLNNPRFTKGELVGRFTGSIPTPDASRYASNIRLDVRLRAGKLSGEVTAQTTSEPQHYGLSSFVELEKLSNPH